MKPYFEITTNEVTDADWPAVDVSALNRSACTEGVRYYASQPLDLMWKVQGDSVQLWLGETAGTWGSSTWNKDDFHPEQGIMWKVCEITPAQARRVIAGESIDEVLANGIPAPGDEQEQDWPRWYVRYDDDAVWRMDSNLVGEYFNRDGRRESSISTVRGIEQIPHRIRRITPAEAESIMAGWRGESAQPDPIAAVEQAIADAVKAAVAPVSSGGGVSAAIHHLKDAQSALPALREMKEDGYWQQFVDMNTKYWELHSDLESARQRYEAIENKAAGLAEKLEQVEADHHRELSELGKELSRRQDVIDKVSARRDKWRARYEHTKRLASGELAAKQNIAEAYKADRDRLQAELGELRQSRNWRPIETAPKGKDVLVFYRNINGKSRFSRACYFRPEIEEPDSHEDCKCIEGTGVWLGPEAWYESSWADDESRCYAIEETITHWMPLPAAPAETGTGQPVRPSPHITKSITAQLAQPSEGREGEGREHTGEHWEPWGFMGTGMASQAAAQRREAAREKLDRDAGSLPSIQEIQLVADAAQPMRNGDEHGWLLTDDDYTLLRAAALAVAHQPQQAGGEPAVHQLLEAIGDNRPWGIERTSDINWIGPLKRGGKVDTIYFRNERGHALKAEAHRCNDALSDLVVLAVNRLIEQHRLTPTQPDHEPEQAKGQVRWYAVDTGILIRKADAVTLVKKDGTTQQQGKWGDADERLVGKGIIKPLDLWNAALTHIGDNQAARLALWCESGEPTEGLYIQRSDETWCIYKFIDGHPHFQHGGSWKPCDLGIYPGTMKLMRDGYYNILTEAEALAKGGG